MEIRKSYIAPVWGTEPERVASTAGGDLYYFNTHQVEGEEKNWREYPQKFEGDHSCTQALLAAEKRGDMALNYIQAGEAQDKGDKPAKGQKKAKAPTLEEVCKDTGAATRLLLGYLKEWRPGTQVVLNVYEDATGWDFTSTETPTK